MEIKNITLVIVYGNAHVLSERCQNPGGMYDRQFVAKRRKIVDVIFVKERKSTCITLNPTKHHP